MSTTMADLQFDLNSKQVELNRIRIKIYSNVHPASHISLETAAQIETWGEELSHLVKDIDAIKETILAIKTPQPKRLTINQACFLAIFANYRSQTVDHVHKNLKSHWGWSPALIHEVTNEMIEAKFIVRDQRNGTFVQSIKIDVDGNIV